MLTTITRTLLALFFAYSGSASGSPWTITYRPFENNVHKIAYAVLPLLALLRLVNPGPAGVALGVTFLVGSLMSNVSREGQGFHESSRRIRKHASVPAKCGLDRGRFPLMVDFRPCTIRGRSLAAGRLHGALVRASPTLGVSRPAQTSRSRGADPCHPFSSVFVVFGCSFLFGQEFHRFAHMTSPPPLVRALQKFGVTLSRKEHGRHHSSPFEEKYCIVTGICNGPLDHFRV